MLLQLRNEAEKVSEENSAISYVEFISRIETLYELSGASEFLADIIKEQYEEVKKSVNTAATSSVSSGEKLQKVKGKTMRVPERSLDDFIHFIGDLIIVREMLNDTRHSIDNADLVPEIGAEMKRHMDTFSITLSKLENSAMSIRKQSVRMLMNKVSRLAREVAVKVDKQINTVLIGADLEIDKSLLELLEAPLIHIINNAVDHGIESADERLTAGKSEEGCIKIKAFEEEENIVFTIEDDGGGMDLERLLDKGKAMGVASESSTKEELLNTIFLAGLSTAEEVTNISGRGVGMDVVKMELERAGGNVRIESERGKGCKFTLTLPKSITTQIIQGFLIDVAGESFIIPLKAVKESFHPSKANIVRMYDKIDCLERRGEILPIVDISNYLYGKKKHSEENIFVIVEDAGRHYALLADKVVGIQQVVLKDLGHLQMKQQVFAGAALMGNGQVGLVFDLSAFLSLQP